MCNLTKTETENLDLLATALSKAQGAMESAKKTSDNPFFKSTYADLAEIVSSARKPLSDNGLSVIQRMMQIGAETFLYTRLMHISGQWIESIAAIKPQKPDVQSLGSYITYIRRYAYAAICGIVAENEDDDGEKTMDRNGKLVIKQTLTAEQATTLVKLFAKLTPEQQKGILDKSGIKNITEINGRDYEIATKYLAKLAAEQSKEEASNEA